MFKYKPDYVISAQYTICCGSMAAYTQYVVVILNGEKAAFL
jgi:hypothetical protein